MDFSPLLNAAHPIPLHGFAALFCFALGAVQFALKKGTRLHVWLGRIWVIAMIIVAGSSLFLRTTIWDFFYFGPIHLLSLLTLYSAVEGVVAIRKGNIAKHKSSMKQLYFFALLLAGAFAFMPGRIMYHVVFGA